MKNYLAYSRKISLEKIKVVQNWQNEEAFIDYKSIKDLLKINYLLLCIWEILAQLLELSY